MVASPGLGREPRPGDRQPTCLPLVLEVPNVGSVILPTPLFDFAQGKVVGRNAVAS